MERGGGTNADYEFEERKKRNSGMVEKMGGEKEGGQAAIGEACDGGYGNGRLIEDKDGNGRGRKKEVKKIGFVGFFSKRTLWVVHVCGRCIY